MPGHTTRFLADFISLNQLPNCRIVTFDLPQIVEKLLQSDPYFINHPEIEFVQGYLPHSLKNFLKTCDQFIDFAIIDAEHSYKAVIQELQLIHPKLKAGGYVFCHDYREYDPQYEGVMYAIDKFATSYSYTMLPLNDSQVCWGAAILRKPVQQRSTLKFSYYQLQMAGHRIADIPIIGNILRRSRKKLLSILNRKVLRHARSFADRYVLWRFKI